MSLSDLVTPEAVIVPLRATSSKQALQEMSERAAQLCGVPSRVISDAIRQRERLGATSVGGGIAIPHAKILNIPSIFAVFARLEKPVDFDARDGAPVDLICMLIAPEGAGADHLKALSRIARALHDPALVARLRGAKDAAALYLLLMRASESRAA